MSRATRVEAVIRSACRRRFVVIAVEQLALALAFVFGGSILMLLLGTQILNWYWLVLLAVAGLVVACVRTKARMLTQYRVAQLLDRRLQLSDSLSTAWFLLFDSPNRDGAAARYQIEHAERLAALASPSKAFPFRGERGWALTGAIAAAAFGLFAVRYLVTNSLSLEPALVPIQLGPIFERIEKSLSAENHSSPDQKSADSGGSDLSSAPPQDSNVPGDALPLQDLKAGKPDGAGDNAHPTQKTDLTGNDSQQDGKSDTREGTPTNNQPAGDKAEDSRGSQPSSQQASNNQEQTATGQQGSSGLIDKMKDALSSLMAKMRPNASSQKSLPNNERLSQDQKGGDQASAAKDQQGQQQNSRNDQASQDQNAEGQAQGQTTEKAQASQGRNSDSTPEKGSDAHSGIGRQDGDKGLKEAQQLQAMGKLAEIIGKRSASVTGEMTIETTSGKQQLKTEYSQRLGRHADLGGEINRDEIPLADQQYVKEYMEQIRKQSKNPQ